MMDVVAIRPYQLRIEVTSSFGIPLASFALSEGRFGLALPRQKKFYQGTSGPNALKPVIPTRLDPRWIVDFLFDAAPSDTSWKCERDEKHFLKACDNSAEKVHVVWTERERQRRVIRITTQQLELELSVGSFQPNVQGSSSMFVLSRPAGFQLFGVPE